MCYENGEGVKKDKTKAAEWYRKSAEQGYARAQCNLGYYYQFGKGILASDDAKAVEWYRKAADQGYACAQYYLGESYKNGWGVEKDKSKALEWYRKAAAQGHEDARKMVAKLT